MFTQGLGLVRSMFDHTTDLLAFAGAASAVFAAIRQANALANAGGQHGLTGVDVKLAQAGQDADVKGGKGKHGGGNGLGNSHRITDFRYALGNIPQAPILPSNQSPLGALPARFRRERLLIVGCGDVGMRAVRALGQGVRVMALTSSPQRVVELRQKGITPLLGNLDIAASLQRLAGLREIQRAGCPF